VFERNRADNPTEPTAVPVEVGLADGSIAKGRLSVPCGKSVADVLNADGGFIEFEPYGGERVFLAKAQLCRVTPIGVPKAANLAARLNDREGFDPYRVLGVTAASTREQRRQAYVALAKIYHPDRYATAELPEEVAQYLAAMVRRINAAHAALEVAQKQPAGPLTS
jgi:hypothetical protein